MQFKEEGGGFRLPPFFRPGGYREHFRNCLLKLKEVSFTIDMGISFMFDFD